MTDPVDRQVRILARQRVVRVSFDDGTTATIAYPGIAFVFRAAGRRPREVWLAQGDDPSDGDDELLIDALRRAFLWAGCATDR